MSKNNNKKSEQENYVTEQYQIVFEEIVAKCKKLLKQIEQVASYHLSLERKHRILTIHIQDEEAFIKIRFPEWGQEPDVVPNLQGEEDEHVLEAIINSFDCRKKFVKEKQILEKEITTVAEEHDALNAELRATQAFEKGFKDTLHKFFEIYSKELICTLDQKIIKRRVIVYFPEEFHEVAHTILLPRN